MCRRGPARRARLPRSLAFRWVRIPSHSKIKIPTTDVVGILMAEDEGFEPPQTESESGVLPLHKSSICNVYIIRKNKQKSSYDFPFFQKFLNFRSCIHFIPLLYFSKKGGIPVRRCLTILIAAVRMLDTATPTSVTVTFPASVTALMA